MDDAREAKQVSPEMERTASQRARDRAGAARWSLEVAVFLFAVLIIVIILLFQGISVEIVSSVALVGLILVWLMGWMQGKRLYRRFYDEELARLERELKHAAADEETIEQKVQKALRDRWK